MKEIGFNLNNISKCRFWFILLYRIYSYHGKD